MEERRTRTRIRSFLKGRIVFNHRNSSFDCLIRDLSDVGARLAVSENIVLPETFDLHVPQKQQTFRSAVRWRRGNQIGVQFAEAAMTRSPLAPIASAARVAELEAENVRLRGLVEALEAELRIVESQKGILAGREVHAAPGPRAETGS